VITDYNIPGMQVVEVALEIRRIRAHLSVALTSGFINEELCAGAERNGVREMVAKPFAINESLRGRPENGSGRSSQG
jgi:DNA-binding NtrC family response regulator